MTTMKALSPLLAGLLFTLSGCISVLPGTVVLEDQPAHPTPSSRWPRAPPPGQGQPPPPRPNPPPPPPPPPSTVNFHVPPDRVPPQGLCRIWYPGLPPDRQPASMTCGHAHRTARSSGGLVIVASSPRSFQTGEVSATDYGPVNFDGVPPDRLPPPGLCRVWLDGVPPDRQSPPTSCHEAHAHQRRVGGRVLFMPASDMGGR